MPSFSTVPTHNPGRWPALVLAGVATASAAAPSAPDKSWHTRLADHGHQAVVLPGDDGYRYTIDSAGERVIARQAAVSDTASAVFDGLFALAQVELGQAHVDEIRYKAFNGDKPLPCSCLVAGQLWPWVWTRDIAYATDLGIYRFDPAAARNSLEFKLSPLRAKATAGHHGQGQAHRGGSALYAVQDTGSGGSWPVSTDRVSWFLGARHLLGDRSFAGQVRRALASTLEQDRRYVFDTDRGLYRGETSFLDWRQQSYPEWTAHDVVYIAESYALSTNVLYYEALQLAASMASGRDAAAAKRYRAQAAALKSAINRTFWREDRGLYMSYVGPVGTPQKIEAYDLLGTALVIESGVAPPARARRALDNYPTWKDGSPVIWPERRDQPVYHNRALWPFASAYALKAARRLDEPARIAHELRSIVRLAALSGSNMENAELSMSAPARVRGGPPEGGPVEDRGDFDFSKATERPNQERRKPEIPDFVTGRHRSHEPHRAGPVVNSRRQLWSIGAYLDVVVEGVFGLGDNGRVEPKLPRELVPMLFGDRDTISLKLPERRITLVLPARLGDGDNLLVAGKVSGPRTDQRVQLRGIHVADAPLPLGRPAYAPATPAPAQVEQKNGKWEVRGSGTTLYADGRATAFSGTATLPGGHARQCVSLTTRGSDGIESLPGKPVCVGPTDSVDGDWPRHWTAARSGNYRLRVDYDNPHGPIMTGITAAVKKLVVKCGGVPERTRTLVMPQSEGRQLSTAVDFAARAGQRCTFTLEDGFNMSYLAHYAKFTGGEGGTGGRVNDARIGSLHIGALP